MPVCAETFRALSGLLPVSRSIIFCLYGIENGFVTLRSLSAFRRNLGKATTTLALGAGQKCNQGSRLLNARLAKLAPARSPNRFPRAS